MAAAPVTVLFGDRGVAAGYLAPGVELVGEARTRLGAPDGYSQWVLAGEVAAGSVLRFGTEHHDQAIYVESGRLEVDGAVAAAGGAVVIERGALGDVRVVDDARIVHFGRADSPEGVAADHRPTFHVVGSDGMFGPGDRPAGETRITFFANGSCPGCDIVLFRLIGEGGHVQHSHSHTADEFIHVLAGAVQVGRDRIEDGMTIAIPADRLYGFRTKEAWSYLNYRPVPSETHLANGELVRR